MINFFKRLDKYIEYKGLNDNKISLKTGISNGIIGKGRKRGALSQDSISKILNTYTELNANWLLIGKGEMLRKPSFSDIIEDDNYQSKKNKNISKIKERILQIAKNKDISYKNFLNKVELKYTNFKGNQKLTGINSNSIDKIISEFPDTDLHWLITGKHKKEDLRKEVTMGISKNYRDLYEEVLEENRQLNKEVIALLKSNNNLKKHSKDVLYEPKLK